MSDDNKFALLLGVVVTSIVGFSIVFRQDQAQKLSSNGSEASFDSSSYSGRNPRSAPLPLPRPKGKSSEASQHRNGFRHRIEPGDPLVGLAQRFYGDGDRFTKIVEANRGVLSTTDPLPIGTEIVIPALSSNIPSAGH